MSNVNTGRGRLDRRQLLCGVGASLALPMLDCMEPVAAAGGALPPPKRCVFLYLPNGVNTLDWQIERAGAEYSLTSPLEPLAHLRSQLTPISGLHHPGGLGTAHECEKIWLTGADVRARDPRARNAVSADQCMAEVTGTHTRFPSLELTITGGSLAWSRAGVRLPAERKPGAVFDRLFGVDPGGVESARRRLGRRASVLDLVLDGARDLRRSVGDSDRGKLDEYLDAVRDVERRTRRADAWLDTPRPEVDAKLAARLTRNVDDARAGELFRTVYDLMALALRTDMTRVITCMTGSEGLGLALPEIDIQQTRHELSHHNGKPETMRRLTRADTFQIQQLAHFLDALASSEEGGESLLDRTMVLFGSGMSYGHSHGNANLPLLLAGGRSLGLRHGRHLDFNLPKVGRYDLQDARAHYDLCLRPADPDARMCNLLLSMLRGMDVEVDSFGDSLGPIDGLLV